MGLNIALRIGACAFREVRHAGPLGAAEAVETAGAFKKVYQEVLAPRVQAGRPSPEQADYALTAISDPVEVQPLKSEPASTWGSSRPPRRPTLPGPTGWRWTLISRPWPTGPMPGVSAASCERSRAKRQLNVSVRAGQAHTGIEPQSSSSATGAWSPLGLTEWKTRSGFFSAV